MKRCDFEIDDLRGEMFITWVNPLKTKRRLLYLKTQSVPRCKHFSSRYCNRHKSLFVLR